MLQSVELVNLLSHANTKLEFAKGVTVFVGPNGAGKSSIIDAITFALFGEHIRKSTKGLLRRGSNQAYSKVGFSIGNRQFEAVRKIDSKGTVSAQLYEKINQEMIPIAAGERRQFGESMTKTIESLIGLDFEKIKIASIVQQGELQSIIESDPRKFKELVNAVIGIDRLDIAYENMKKIIDVFRNSTRSRLGYDDTNIMILQNKQDTLEKNITSLRPQKKKIEEEKASLEYEFVVLQKQIELEAPKELKLKEIDYRKNELMAYLKNAVSSIKKELADKERKLSDCSNGLSIISSKSLLVSEETQVKHKIERVRSESKDTSEKIAIIIGQQDIAKKIRLVNGTCPVCNSKVDELNPLFEEEHLRMELDVLKKKIEKLMQEDSILQSKKNDINLKLEHIIRAEGVLVSYNIKDGTDLMRLKEEIVTLQNNVKVPLEVSKSGNLLEFAIDQYSEDAIKSISSLTREIKDFDAANFLNLKTKLEQKRKLLSSIDQEIGAVNTKIKLHNEELEKITSVLKELTHVKEYVTNLETIRTLIYNRDGPVATSLRSWALGTISEKASEYLSTFNVKVQRISLVDKARDIGITCYSNNSTLDLESLSGGEKVSVALALRLGMAHIMGSSNLNFIVLDEPTTHLDQERRKLLVNALTQAFDANLDSISQFIIITHDSEIFEDSNIDAIYEFKSTSEGTLVTPV